MVKYYKIVKDDSMVSPYAVFVKCTGFWQQISPWYFRRGYAERYLRKIASDEIKVSYHYVQINGKDRLTSIEIEIEQVSF